MGSRPAALPESVTEAQAEPERAPLLELRDVTRVYPNGTAALAGVSVTLHAGESVAIVGRSGSGKSTLLNVIGLLDSPSSGEVLIDGHHLEGATDAQRSQRRAADLGFVFQRAHLIGELSVRDNVLLGLHYSARAEAESTAAEQALAAVGLEERMDVPARTLSGGEMQRVAIARTLARPARLWLADEPTGNLDSAQSVEIIELLKARAAERGAALIVVTHEPEIAERMDRTIQVIDGLIVSDTGTTSATAPALMVETPERRSLWQRIARTAQFITQGVAASPGRARSGIAAAAVAVALTVTALGLAQSASSQVTAMFDAQRATKVTASLSTPDPTRTGDGPDVQAVRDFPGVVGVEYWVESTGIRLANGDVAATDGQVVETATAPGEVTDSVISWASTDDQNLGAGEAILGATLAQRLGVAQLDLQPEIEINGAPVRVVGLLTESSSGTAPGAAFVTPETAAHLPPSRSSILYAQTVPGAARQLADRLTVIADPYAAWTWTIDPVLEADAYRGRLEDSISASLLVLAVVASLAGLVGVVFVNVLSVNARTAELGVRRAFGARRGDLIALVLGESTLLGVIGSVLGVAVGFVVIMGVTAVQRWQPVFDPALLAVPLVGALVFGTLGGILPAFSASRIEPADAVRQ